MGILAYAIAFGAFVAFVRWFLGIPRTRAEQAQSEAFASTLGNAFRGISEVAPGVLGAAPNVPPPVFEDFEPDGKHVLVLEDPVDAPTDPGKRAG